METRHDHVAAHTSQSDVEAVVEPGNLKKALARVRRNKGAPAVDGMTVDELSDSPEGPLQAAGGKRTRTPFVRGCRIPWTGRRLRPKADCRTL